MRALMKSVCLKGTNISFGNKRPFVVIGGLNVLADYDLAARTCEHFMQATDKLKMPFIFKASFDKANRSSLYSYRGPGLKQGMKIFDQLKEAFNVPIITDVHEPWQCDLAKGHVDMLQLPAFLARQTDLVNALAAANLPVNVKKPQFMAPSQVANILTKFKEAGNDQVLLCERGSQFCYDNLVVDMLGFGVMKKVSQDTPLIFDFTHSLQCRSADAKASGGRREQVLDLAKAGVSQKIAAIFVETHPDPDKTLCDGSSALPLKLVEPVLEQIKALDELVKAQPDLEIR